MADFKTLEGETLLDVEVVGDTKVYFTTMTGRRFEMYHDQD